ncbi:translation elongation factor EF protein [Medicago truncatula]|uniref:Translation elongation factor EF protein n=1 Tax=Medicago truncatula TaxID=3880 RepID=G7LAJ0_MEDTR|nr:translation elongation factor EF protein [Medicago truncatula]
MQAFVLKKRRELIEIVSEVDDKLSEAFHGGSQILESYLDDAIRGATIARKFDVIRYLPSPIDVSNYALDQNKNGEKVELSGSVDAPFVAKGVIKKGDFITNVNTGEKIQIYSLSKRHDDVIEFVDEAHAGEIVIVLAIVLKSGDTFTDGSVRYTMSSADVPTYSVSKDSGEKFSNGVN